MKENENYLKKDLIKSVVLSVMCIAVIVIMYYIGYKS